MPAICYLSAIKCHVHANLIHTYVNKNANCFDDSIRIDIVTL